MSILQHLPLPHRLSPRVWLVTLPSALMSFERRRGLPKLPIGRGRFLGLPLIAAGVGLWACVWRRPSLPAIAYRFTRWTRDPIPGVTAGLMVLGGFAILIRSPFLALYSLALAVASRSHAVEVEDPHPDDLLTRDGRGPR